jgi:hypothetical protein
MTPPLMHLVLSVSMALIWFPDVTTAAFWQRSFDACPHFATTTGNNALTDGVCIVAFILLSCSRLFALLVAGPLLLMTMALDGTVSVFVLHSPPAWNVTIVTGAILRQTLLL